MKLPAVNNFRRKPAPIFSPGEVHRPKRRFFYLIEVFLVILVLGGTTAAFVSFKGGAIGNFFRSLPARFTPQQEEKKQTPQVSFEDQLKIELAKASLNFDRFEKTNEGNYLVVIGKSNIFFNQSKDSASQVSTLQTLLSKAKIEGRQVKKVDFRFEKLIVEY